MARERKRPMSERQAIDRAISRRARPVPGTAQDHARQLEQRMGRDRARERAGVSDRTWRRWLAGGTPSKANASRLASQARVSPVREARMRNRGAFVRMAGMVGGTPGARRSNWRHRTLGDVDQQSIYMTGDEMSELLDRYYGGDIEGAYGVLTEALKDQGFGPLKVDDLTLLEFLRGDPNG